IRGLLSSWRPVPGSLLPGYQTKDANNVHNKRDRQRRQTRREIIRQRPHILNQQSRTATDNERNHAIPADRRLRVVTIGSERSAPQQEVISDDRRDQRNESGTQNGDEVVEEQLVET